MPKNRVTETAPTMEASTPWQIGTLLVLSTPKLIETAYYLVTDENDTYVNLGSGVIVDASKWSDDWKKALRPTNSVTITRI